MANIEAEVISAICENKDISTALTAQIDDMFISHADVWEGVKSYYYRHGSVPPADVLVRKFDDFVPEETSGPTDYYVDLLRDSFVRGNIKNYLLDAGKELRSEPSRLVLDKLQSQLSRLSQYTAVAGDIDLSDFESAKRHYEQVHDNSELNGGNVGIMTGLKSFDASVPTGLAPGNLVILLGYSGRGKTWLAGYLATRAYTQGKKPMIASMEMTAEAMRDRIYSTMANGSFYVSDFQTGAIDTDDFNTWGKKQFKDKQSFTVVSSEGLSDISVSTLQGKIDQHQPDIVFVDYIQLMSDGAGNRNETEKIRNISRGLKRLALRNNIPVVAISAVTSAELNAPDTPPMLEQVSWSRSIQFDADLAIAVHKYDDTNIVECVSRKNRFGPDFCAYLEVDFSRGMIKETFAPDS